MDYEKLILENLGIAYKVAAEYTSKVSYLFEPEDLRQICLEGLVKASKTFDETKGIKFSTYAYTIIKNHLINQSIFAERTQHRLVVVSLDASISVEDGETTLVSQLTSNIDLEEQFLEQEAINELYNNIEKLPAPYKDVMYLRCKNKTLEQISIILGLELKNVVAIYKSGLNKLRNLYGGVK